MDRRTGRLSSSDLNTNCASFVLICLHVTLIDDFDRKPVASKLNSIMKKYMKEYDRSFYKERTTQHQWELQECAFILFIQNEGEQGFNIGQVIQ